MMAILLANSEILHLRLEERKIHRNTWKGVDQLCQSLKVYESFFSIHTWALFSDAKMVWDTRLTKKAGDGAIKVEMVNLVPLPQVAEQAAHPLQPAHLGKPHDHHRNHHHDHHHHHHHDHHHHHQQVLPAVSATWGARGRLYQKPHQTQSQENLGHHNFSLGSFANLARSLLPLSSSAGPPTRYHPWRVFFSNTGDHHHNHHQMPTFKSLEMPHHTKRRCVGQ